MHEEHESSYFAVEGISISSTIVADALVLAVTWRATGSISALARRLRVDVSLSTLILADGEQATSSLCLSPPISDISITSGTIYFWYESVSYGISILPDRCLLASS